MYTVEEKQWQKSGKKNPTYLPTCLPILFILEHETPGAVPRHFHTVESVSNQ